MASARQLSKGLRPSRPGRDRGTARATLGEGLAVFGVSALRARLALYGVSIVKRFQNGVGISLFLVCFIAFFVRPGNHVSSPRPAVLQSRRAQELSRLAVTPTFPR